MPAKYQVTLSVVQVGSRDLTEVRLPEDVQNSEALLKKLLRGNSLNFLRKDDFSGHGRFKISAAKDGTIRERGSAGFYIGGKVEF